jgi:hypothetical protein
MDGPSGPFVRSRSVSTEPARSEVAATDRTVIGAPRYPMVSEWLGELRAVFLLTIWYASEPSGRESDIDSPPRASSRRSVVSTNRRAAWQRQTAQKDARLTTEGAVDWPRHGEQRTCQSTERTQTHVTPPRSAQGATTVIFHTFGEQPRRPPASGPIGHYGTCRDRARPLPAFRVVVCGPRPGHGFG